MDISERLKFIRNKTGLSQVKFGKELNVSGKTIDNIEGGRQKSIPIELGQKISKKYDIDFTWLMTGEGEPSPRKVYNPTDEEALKAREEAAKKWGVTPEEADNLLSYALKFKDTDMIETLFRAEKGEEEALLQLEGMIKAMRARIKKNKDNS